jgi:hypothetical protein
VREEKGTNKLTNKGSTMRCGESSKIREFMIYIIHLSGY